ncbi:MAG: hypothetical protein BGO41_05490 [Clostridiales bacterium 38-18]|nr:MAG: hypothetical protein BGO41_05490 [Clostridiales bacterium 38-18]
MKTNRINIFKPRKILILFLVLVMCFPMASSAESPSEATLREANEQGTAMGTLDGDLAGRADRNANKTSSYSLAMPKDTDIVTRYALNKDSSTYQNYFISAYRAAFEIAYNSGYRAVNLEEYAAPFEDGYAHGKEAGTVQGQLSAMVDFVQSRSNNWLRTYNEFISKGSLTSRYFLDRESSAYKGYFSSGYREAFKNSYIETFQVKNLETEIRNKNARIISMLEDTLYFDEEYVHFTSGVAESEIRTPMSLYFPAATVYEPTYFATFKTQNTFNFKNTKYTPVSSKYTVSILNNSGSVYLRNPITLTFEYYGSEKAGIYQWIDNQWEYKYTTLTDNSLSIQIPAGYYNGGEYEIFIDEDFKNIADISFNWAYKEIYTLARRSVISDNQLFSPGAYITRAELSDLIYKTMSISDPLKLSPPTIKDSASLGSYKAAIEYTVGKRYFSLDANSNFNPSGSVTYKDVENMLSRMFLRDIKWREVGNKMLTEKFTKSVGLTDINAKITKAEAVYMLIYFFK